MDNDFSPMSSVLESMPTPSEFAATIPIPSEAAEVVSDSVTVTEASPTVSAFAEIDDSKFNPEYHAAGPNGNGIITASGKYRRKPGRKKGTASVKQTEPGTINSPGTVSGGATDVIDVARMQKAKAAAQICTAATFILGQVICGSDGAPIIDPAIGINEPIEFESAYTQAFYVAEKPIEIPPWILVALVVTNYSARRAVMPNTQTRLQRIGKWIKRTAVNTYLWIKGY